MTVKKGAVEYHFLDMGSMSDVQLNDLKAITDMKERNRRVMNIAKDKWTKEDLLRISNVSFIEELTCVFTFFFGVPGAVFVFPVALALVYIIWGALPCAVGSAAFISLAFMKVDMSEDALTSWPAIAMVRYFSFKGIFSQLLEKDKAYILVAPPHGVHYKT